MKEKSIHFIRLEALLNVNPALMNNVELYSAILFMVGEKINAFLQNQLLEVFQKHNVLHHDKSHDMLYMLFMNIKYSDRVKVWGIISAILEWSDYLYVNLPQLIIYALEKNKTDETDHS